MKLFIILSCVVVAINAEAPVYPQVRFQPLQNIVVLPSTSQQLKELAENTTKQQDTKPKEGADVGRVITMEELRAVDGSVTGSYHVLLENGKLQRVDFTAAPRLPQRQVQPELRSWYYTQVPADVVQRYYAEYYAQQNAQYKRPSVSQATNSNSQGASQSAGHGVNVASNHNVQVNQQKGKSHYEAAASHQFQQTIKSNSLNSGHLQNTQSFPSGQRFNGEQRGQNADHSHINAEQRMRSKDEVETFEPVQGRKEIREEEYPPNSVVATIYYTDVSPITGPIYTFDQTPLVRILRQA